MNVRGAIPGGDRDSSCFPDRISILSSLLSAVSEPLSAREWAWPLISS